MSRESLVVRAELEAWLAPAIPKDKVISAYERGQIVDRVMHRFDDAVLNATGSERKLLAEAVKEYERAAEKLIRKCAPIRRKHERVAENPSEYYGG